MCVCVCLYIYILYLYVIFYIFGGRITLYINWDIIFNIWFGDFEEASDPSAFA